MRTRLLAILCDFALLVPSAVPLLLLPAWVATGFAPKDSRGEITETAAMWIAAALIGFTATLLLGYLSSGNIRGKTGGKRFVGLRVVRFDTGDALGIRRGLIRTLAQLVTIATLGIGYVIALFDSQRRTLHDRIAGSVVVEL